MPPTTLNSEEPHCRSRCSYCVIVDDSDEEALSNGGVRGTTASIGSASV